MLQNCEFYTLCSPESLSDGRVFIFDVFFNYSLDSFDFIETVVKSYNLADKLRSLGNQIWMDDFIDLVESISKAFIDWSDAM